MSSTITAHISIDGGPSAPGTLTIDVDQIVIQSAAATKPDPRWEYIDPFGHFHAYDADGKLPTLEARTRHVDCDGIHLGPMLGSACEGFGVMDYHCLICDAAVEPGRIPDTEPKTIPGREDWSMEIEQLVDRGAKVSVRATTVGGDELFGVAIAGSQRAEGGPDGVRAWTTLHAAGPLGRRKRAAVSAAS